MHQIDLNCDLGELDGDEGLELDAAILPSISSANVACGFHAGSAARLRQLAILCREHGIDFGAHPGYPDRAGFGRVVIPMAPQRITDIVTIQIILATAIAESEGIRLSHVKPHGALYNLAAEDAEIAAAFAAAIRRACPAARLVGLAGSRLITAGKAIGLSTTSEFFADRNYCAGGSLVPRDQSDAVLHDAHDIAQRIVALHRTGRMRTTAGTEIPVVAETVCVHSDTHNAVEIATTLRRVLEENGIVICRPGNHCA